MLKEIPIQRLNRLRSEVAATIATYQPLNERGETAVPHLAVGHIDKPMPAQTYIYEPSLCICVQGLKHVLLGDRRFAYGKDSFLLTSIGLPTIIEVPGASVKCPYTALQLRLDLNVARQVMADMVDMVDKSMDGSEATSSEPGFGIAALSPDLLDVVARLVALLGTPRDIPILGNLLHREVLYRLLTGPAGARLRQIIRVGSPSHRVAEALGWLRTNYARPCRIEELAELCSMGVSTLHRHFQELTTMSPMQYQKHLRLHEARRLMLSEDLDAGSAALSVGYESATQFSREYRRLFGAPPRRDITAIRQNGSMSAVA